MVLGPNAAIALALVGGAWLAIALWVSLRGARLAREAAATDEDRLRRDALIAASPAAALVVGPDGGMEADPRLAAMLGIGALPVDWAALAAMQGESAAELARLVEEARSGAPSTMTFAPPATARILKAEVEPAPPAFGPRSVLIWVSDATDSARQAEALRERLDRRGAALDALSGLIEAAPFPVWHRGPDLSLTMVNGAYAAAVEAGDAAEVIERQLELIDEADGMSATANAANAQASGETLRQTLPVTVGGERRAMRVVETPLAAGGVAGFAIDVDDEEEARAELARFARAQRDMLDRLSAGVAQFGRDRGLDFFNQAFARTFSLTADFLADRPEFDRLIDAMREAGNLPETRDYPEWKDERRLWFTSGLAADEEDWLLPGGKHLRVVAQPLPDGGLLLIFEDRTEQIQLASARDTLLRVRSATFDNLFEAIGVFASDGRLNLWNNRFRDLWGFDEELLAGHPRVDALTPHLAARLKRAGHAGLLRELVRSATQERKQRSGRVALKDGREFEFAAVPLPDGAALFTMLDITDSRKVEAALRERTGALEEADRLKTAFVSNMSYELRTPLTSIAGFAEMMAGGYAGELSATGTDYVAAILESVSRLGALIDNVLDLTQSDTGSLLLAEDEVDLAALCGEALLAAGDKAKRKRIDLAGDIDATVGVVTGDTRRLGQALGNVIANAIGYTDEGGRVFLRAEGDAGEARIFVSDNGRGIAPADQSLVFDRFSRTVDGRGDEAAAVGLGLPLARQFLEAHGGTIALESEPGEGTTITIRLPRTAEQQADYPVQGAAAGA
jgi:signal transduction histidine kinase